MFFKLKFFDGLSGLLFFESILITVLALSENSSVVFSVNLCSDFTEEGKPNSTLICDLRSNADSSLDYVCHIRGLGQGTEWRFDRNDVDDCSSWGSEVNKLMVPKASVTLARNGYLSVDGEMFIPSHMYCISRLTILDIGVKACNVRMACELESFPCVPKCCHPDEIFVYGSHTGHKGCHNPGTVGLPDDYLYQPVYYEDLSTIKNRTENDSLYDLSPVLRLVGLKDIKKGCGERSVSIIARSSSFADDLTDWYNGSYQFAPLQFGVTIAGDVMYRNFKGQCTKGTPPYCLDFSVLVSDHEHAQAFQVNDPEENLVLINCSIEPPDDPTSIIFGWLVTIMSIFPFLTAFIFMLLWSKQNAHGKSVTCTCVALWLFYVFIGTSHLVREYVGHTMKRTFLCAFIGVGAHFFELASCSWLTVLSYDLWQTFRNVSPRNQNSSNSDVFEIYSLFGWSIPTVIVLFCLILDATYEEDSCVSIPLAHYGLESCWLEESAQGLYLYYPSIILVVINIVFFILVVHKLCSFRSGTSIMSSKDSKKQCLGRFTKLFFVMGVTWIFESISYFVSGVGLSWYWILFDLLNILRAMAVFYIYICKKEVLVSLERAYPRFKEFTDKYCFKAKSEALYRSQIEMTNATAETSTRIVGGSPKYSPCSLRSGINSSAPAFSISP